MTNKETDVDRIAKEKYELWLATVFARISNKYKEQ